MPPSAELYPWYSVALIAWGVLDCFFGYRIFKITLAVVGGIVGVGFGQTAATALGFSSGGVLASLIVGGLLGMALAFLLYIAAVFVTGFLFGAWLGVLLLASYHPLVALLSGGVLGLVGGFLAIKVQRVLIILSTALRGASCAILALAYFTHQIDWLYYCRQPDQLPALIDSNPWMLPAILGVTAVGGFAQFELGDRKGKKKAKEKDE